MKNCSWSIGFVDGCLHSFGETFRLRGSLLSKHINSWDLPIGFVNGGVQRNRKRNFDERPPSILDMLTKKLVHWASRVVLGDFEANTKSFRRIPISLMMQLYQRLWIRNLLNVLNAFDSLIQLLLFKSHRKVKNEQWKHFEEPSDPIAIGR